MINGVNIQNPAYLDEAVCDVFVLIRGLQITGGVVVGHDHMSCTF